MHVEHVFVCEIHWNYAFKRVFVAKPSARTDENFEVFAKEQSRTAVLFTYRWKRKVFPQSRGD